MGGKKKIFITMVEFQSKGYTLKSLLGERAAPVTRIHPDYYLAGV